MIKYYIYFGKDVLPHIPIVSKMRILEFENYPYLYIGNEEYEKEYLLGFSKDPHSCLAIARDGEEIVGMATAMPLKSEADILKEAEELFSVSGYRPEDFFYFGEFIVLEKYRGKGIARKLEQDLLNFAKKWNFPKACLSVVVRDENDSRKPVGYISGNSTWTKMGYKEIDLKINYHWPTIQEDGEIKDILNEMVFWIKDIE